MKAKPLKISGYLGDTRRAGRKGARNLVGQGWCTSATSSSLPRYLGAQRSVTFDTHEERYTFTRRKFSSKILLKSSVNHGYSDIFVCFYKTV